jgi:hypothetical protein
MPNSDGTDVITPHLSPEELKLSFDTLELLFRQLGVPITPTHMKQLKAKGLH